MNAGDAAARLRSIRIDLQVVADMVTPESRVLDVGCGDGALLDYLVHFKRVDGRGLEISQAGVNACVGQGLSVIQGDADTDLKTYPSKSFDYIILSQTLPAIHDPKAVLLELARIGRRAIVSFPNFGHWKVRWHLLQHGRTPVVDSPTHEWFETPNIHPCTIKDFIRLCDKLDITIERAISLSHWGYPRPSRLPRTMANLLDRHGLFLLRKD